MSIPGNINGNIVGWLNTSSSTTHTITITVDQADEVMVVMVANTALAAVNFHTVTSVTGGGLTWARYANGGVADGAFISSNPTGHGGMGLEVWWARAPAPTASAVVTVTMSGQPSNGFLAWYGVINVADPSAPWDTHAPTVATGTVISPTSPLATYTTTARTVLPVLFLATSNNLEFINVRPATWGSIMSGGGGAGSYPSLDLTPYRLIPNLPYPLTPTPYGCDPRTATSLTASWDTIAPVQYPTHINEAITVNTTATANRIYVAIVGAFLGAPLGNTVSYEVEYFRDDGEGDWLTTTTPAISTTLTGLDAAADYDWHVRTVDSAAGHGDYSGDVMCPWAGAAAPILAIDDVVCSVEDAPEQNLISLRWSNDRGHSYGNPVSQNFGDVGKYKTSLQWQRLEFARYRVFELSWSAPCRAALQGCWIDVTPGKS